MTKKPDVDSEKAVLNLRVEKRKFEERLAKKAATASSLRSRLPRIDFPQSRATYQYITDMQDNDTQVYGSKPLRQNELRSIYALFAWIANEQGTAEETVQSMTEARFHVKDVTSLKQKEYDEVIKFLVDLRIDEMRH